MSVTIGGDLASRILPAFSAKRVAHYCFLVYIFTLFLLTLSRFLSTFMACTGCPAMGPRNYGVLETINNGISGYLIEYAKVCVDMLK